MLRLSVFDEENKSRKCVSVYLNGDFEKGKVLYMEPDWTYLDFLTSASQRLHITPIAKRVFNANGMLCLFHVFILLYN